MAAKAYARRAEGAPGAEGVDGRDAARARSASSTARASPSRRPRSAPTRCASLNEQLLQGARGLQRPPQAQAAARAPPQGVRGGRRARLGARRVARLGVAAPAGRADPPDRPGHRARHVQPAPPEAARREDRRAATCRSSTWPSAEAPFELHNSPLSEAAALGFEYGYSAQAPEALVLWEAQFGDFVNGAQVIIDQFIVSALAKWGQTTRLTLLLPHGYEGAGPEHSSGRLERFLQLGAEGNIRVANCTTPAQYFHLLRRQALITKRRPLVIMTPKSLLRLPAAASPLERPGRGPLPARARRPGAARQRARTSRGSCSAPARSTTTSSTPRSAPQAPNVAVARVELLYPFAENELRALMASYPNLKTVVWAQEEPKNMGARAIMESRLGLDPARRDRLRVRGPPAPRQPGRGLHRRAPRRAGAHRARGAGRRVRLRVPTPAHCSYLPQPRAWPGGIRSRPASK